MESEFWHRVLKVVVILVLGALGVYIIISAFPAIIESRFIFEFIAVILFVIGIIIIGLIRSWK